MSKKQFFSFRIPENKEEEQRDGKGQTEDPLDDGPKTTAPTSFRSLLKRKTVSKKGWLFKTLRGSSLWLRMEPLHNFTSFGAVRILLETDGAVIYYKDYTPSRKYQRKENSFLVLEIDTEPFLKLGEALDEVRYHLNHLPIHMALNKGEADELQDDPSKKKELTNS